MHDLHDSRIGKHLSEEVFTGSAHPRQVADWLSEIDKATSKQDLDDAGCVCVRARTNFDTLDSRIATGLMKIVGADSKERFRWPMNYFEGKCSRS